MAINEVIAHLQMLGFKKRPHGSTIYSYSYGLKTIQIDVTISIKRICIRKISLIPSNTTITRTNHKQGLRYLAKLLYNLEQEN